MLPPDALAPALMLLSALLHAAVNLLVKVSGDGLVLRGCMNGIAFLVAVPFLLVVPAPAPDVQLVLLASVLIHAIYPFFLVWAYRSGDLNALFPLMRGSVPVLVTCFAWLAMAERPGIAGIAGIALISIAVASFAWFSPPAAASHRKGVALALATGVIVAVYTVIDAAGLRLAVTPFSYIVWLFALDGACVATLVGVTRRRAAVDFIRENWRTAVAAGVMGVLTYGLALYALAIGTVAEIAALRETSVVFAAILGAWFLREPLGRLRLVAALVTFGGILLLYFR